MSRPSSPNSSEKNSDKIKQINTALSIETLSAFQSSNDLTDSNYSLNSSDDPIQLQTSKNELGTQTDHLTFDSFTIDQAFKISDELKSIQTIFKKLAKFRQNNEKILHQTANPAEILENLERASINSITTSYRISLIAKAVSILSLFYSKTKDNSAIEIRDEIVTLVRKLDEIAEKEKFSTNINGKTSLKLDETISDIATPEIRNLCQESLLANLIVGLVTEFNQPIINAYLDLLRQNQGILSQRQELLNLALSQNALAPDYDMSSVIDKLIKSGIPKPNQDIITKATRDQRSSNGNNHVKIALSVFQYFHDSSLIEKFLDDSLSKTATQRLTSPRRLSPTNKNLKNFIKDELIRRSDTPESMSLAIHIFITQNDDRHLEELLTRNSKTLAKIEDHNQFLVRAVKEKHIKTFDILVSNGVDPRKFPDHEQNCIEAACVDQGKVIISKYLEAIKKSYPQNHTAIIQDLITCRDHLNETSGLTASDAISNNISDSGNRPKSALRNSLEGRSYTNVVELLIQNGAQITDQDLEISVERSHPSTLEFLLNSLRNSNNPISAQSLQNLAEKASSSYHIGINEVLISEASKNNNPSLLPAVRTTLAPISNNHQWPTLHEICEKYGEKAFSRFLEAHQTEIKETINEKDHNQHTPIHCAVSHNAYNKLIESLIEHGALLDIECENKYPLTTAIANQEPETIRLLLQKLEKGIGLSDVQNKTKIIEQALDEIADVRHNNEMILNSFVESLSSKFGSEPNKRRDQNIATLFSRLNEHRINDSAKYLLRLCPKDLQSIIVHSVIVESINSCNPELLENLAKVCNYRTVDYLLNNQAQEIDFRAIPNQPAFTENDSKEKLQNSTKSENSKNSSESSPQENKSELQDSDKSHHSTNPTPKVTAANSSKLINQSTLHLYIDKTIEFSKSDRDNLEKYQKIIQTLLDEKFGTKMDNQTFHKETEEMKLNRRGAVKNNESFCVIS